MKKEMTERSSWVSALSAVPEHDLIALSEELACGWQVRPKALPQTGLGLLKLNDGALRDDFYLGEFPLASAWLEVLTPEGQRAEGAAQVMHDSQAVAEAMALCDAVLSARLPGWQRVAWLIEKGEALRDATQRERKLMLAHTRVDFSMLDEVGA